jgi:tetratricopeptide (TPR) repeat protein
MPPTSTGQQALFTAAVEHHRAGRPHLSEPLCRQVLAGDPNHADALHLLGILAHQRGQHEQAAELVRRAVAQSPGAAVYRSTLGEALRCSGRVDAAIASQREAVALDPGYAQGHNNLGVALEQEGLVAEAVLAFEKAVELRAGYAVAHKNLGGALEKLGRTDAAVAHYRRAVEIDPGYASAFVSLGAAAARAGRLDEAIGLCLHATRLRPDHVEAHRRLAVALAERGDTENALTAWQNVVRLDPADGEASFRLGVACAKLERHEAALDAWERCMDLRPGGWADLHYNRGIAYAKLKRWDDAVAAYTKAIELRPSWAMAHNNLATVHARRDDLPAAMAHWDAALRIDPRLAEAHNNLGAVHHGMGNLAAAMEAWDAALRIEPGFPEAHVHRAMVLLLQGDFEAGWAELEHRWVDPQDVRPGRRLAGSLASPRPGYPEPLWDGADPVGKTIFLHAEQGLGDTVQFVRYAPRVASRGARVMIGVQPSLKQLLTSVPGVSEVVAVGEPLPPFDLHLPLLSLPHVLGTNAASIPADVPYVTPDPGLVEAWRQRLAPFAGRFRVGLVWAGSPDHADDRRRSCRLDTFAPLGRVPGVVCFSLQVGSAAEQAKAPPDGMTLVDCVPALTDFSETAALLANLDLLVSVDTAPAHLAGAMARPVWVLLPFVPDWRWLLRGDTTAWYPSMRLYRQTKAGDHASVVERAAAELSRLAARPERS